MKKLTKEQKTILRARIAERVDQCDIDNVKVEQHEHKERTVTRAVFSESVGGLTSQELFAVCSILGGPLMAVTVDVDLGDCAELSVSVI